MPQIDLVALRVMPEALARSITRATRCWGRQQEALTQTGFAAGAQVLWVEENAKSRRPRQTGLGRLPAVEDLASESSM